MTCWHTKHQWCPSVCHSFSLCQSFQFRTDKKKGVCCCLRARWELCESVCVCVCFFKRPKFCLINRMWPIAGGRESELSKCIFTVTHCFTLAPASKLSWLLQWSQKRSDSLLSDTLTALEVSLPAFNPAFLAPLWFKTSHFACVIAASSPFYHPLYRQVHPTLATAILSLRCLFTSY